MSVKLKYNSKSEKKEREGEKKRDLKFGCFSTSVIFILH